MSATLLETTTARTYRSKGHIFTVEKVELVSRPDCAQFSVYCEESYDRPLTPAEVPSHIIDRADLISIITEMS